MWSFALTAVLGAGLLAASAAAQVQETAKIERFVALGEWESTAVKVAQSAEFAINIDVVAAPAIN